MKQKIKDDTHKLLEELNKKMDALILLNSVENLSGKEKLSILKHSVGIKPAARILERDKSYFKKQFKNKSKNEKTK